MSTNAKRITREEAIELEKQMDKVFSDALEEDCECSLTFASTFRIRFNENSICINTNNGAIVWIKYDGSYSALNHYIAEIYKCTSENKELIDKLIWSYEHIMELED